MTTSSSTSVETNHVEEIKDLKAQVTSLKKDLEKCHEGKSTLNNISEPKYDMLVSSMTKIAHNSLVFYSCI